jgi:hypothetical protein
MMNQTSGVQLLKTRTLLAFIASIVGYGCGIDINEIRLTNTGLDVTYPEDIRRPSVALNVLQRQRIAISNMPSVVATYSHTGAVRSLHGNTRLSVVSAHELKPGASGQRLLDQFSDVLLSNHTETLIVSSNSVLRGEYRVIKLDQYIRGVPVISGGLAIGISESTGLVDSVQAAFLPDRDLAEHPSIASDDVQGLAENLLVSQMNAIQETIEIFSAPRLGYYGATREAEHQALVWIVDATYQATNGEFVSMELWIDATSGMYVGHKPTTHNILSRAVLSANNSTTLTNGLPSNMTLLFVEGDPPSGDSVANNAYNNASTVYNAWTPVGSAFSYPHMNIVVHVGVDWAKEVRSGYCLAMERAVAPSHRRRSGTLSMWWRMNLAMVLCDSMERSALCMSLTHVPYPSFMPICLALSRTHTRETAQFRRLPGKSRKYSQIVQVSEYAHGRLQRMLSRRVREIGFLDDQCLLARSVHTLILRSQLMPTIY